MRGVLPFVPSTSSNYLHRSFSYRRADCGAGAAATATLRLTNDAPRSGLPPYVTIRADKHGPGVRPGDNLLLVTYYADAGAGIEKVTLDGVPLDVSVRPEGNTVSADVAVELPVARTRVLTVTVREPGTTHGLQVLRQPGVRTETEQVDDCR